MGAGGTDAVGALSQFFVFCQNTFTDLPGRDIRGGSGSSRRTPVPLSYISVREIWRASFCHQSLHWIRLIQDMNSA